MAKASGWSTTLPIEGFKVAATVATAQIPAPIFTITARPVTMTGLAQRRTPMRTDEFYALARERYGILLKRRAGEPKPWTEDWALKNYRFCNTFREDDKVTDWIRVNLREPLEGQSRKLVLAMSSARFVNRISSMEIVKDLLIEQPPDLWEKFQSRLQEESPIFGAAYVIRSPEGMKKLPGVISILKVIWTSPEPEYYPKTLEGFHRYLCDFPYIGGFMGYEILSDLRHTHLLRNAPDLDTWCHLGPGAKRGIRRFLGLPLRSEPGTSVRAQQMANILKELLAASRDEQFWPAKWPRWEMREVEHTLCEFDKYERVRLKEGTPKQLYNGRD